jgi:hypothetical protein
VLYDTNQKYKDMLGSEETEIKDVLLFFDNKMRKCLFSNGLKTHIKGSTVSGCI